MTGLAEVVGVSPVRVAELVGSLAARSLTVAAAESLTGGLLTALLTEVPGSSAVVRGGLVVYATELKHRLAGVEAELLERHGPVHPEVAVQLARGAAGACGAAIGLGLTGVAGPDRQHDVEVGTCYVACWQAGAARLTRLDPGTDRLPSRAQVRGSAVRAALDLLEAC